MNGLSHVVLTPEGDLCEEFGIAWAIGRSIVLLDERRWRPGAGGTCATGTSGDA